MHAPSHWRTLEFHSDVHLYDRDQDTFLAWARYLSSSKADAVFILGDLFEVWMGDDGFDATCAFDLAIAHALRSCTNKRPVFFIPGNRDFLVGDRYLRSVGIQRLPDPTVLCIAGKRVALSHGDVLCTDDLPYQEFRAEVRTLQWQRAFLALPLETRQTKARGMRQASEHRKQNTQQYTDVNGMAVDALMEQLPADVLIHGHTHIPGSHRLPSGKQRMVLSDWCAWSTPPRLEILQVKVQQSAPTFTRVAVDLIPAA